MCSADTTLEKLRHGEDGKELASVDGWGITHQCADYAQVLKWTTAHRVVEDGGI